MNRAARSAASVAGLTSGSRPGSVEQQQSPAIDRVPVRRVCRVPGVCKAAHVAIYLLSSLIWSGSARSDNEALAYAVKAAYLCKLPAFVTWPAGTQTDNDFVLCVIGDDPFGSLLDRAANGQAVQQRPVVVRRYQTVTNNPGCQLIFVAGSRSQSVAAVLAAVHGTPVLTVTDGERDPASIGIINFVLADGHVRFEIDQGSAAQNGLAISSKLLSLATAVRGQPAQ
jgi:hypothetical protein